MSYALYHVSRFLTHFAWLIWPASLLADGLMSNLCCRDKAFYHFRWVARILHGGTLAAIMIAGGVQFFWLRVVHIHYHGGWEIRVVAVLVLYVAIRLAQRIDVQATTDQDTCRRNSGLAFWLPLATALLLLLATINTFLRCIPLLTERERVCVFVAAFLSLIAMGCISNCIMSRRHLSALRNLASTAIAGTLVLFVAAGGHFLGFMPSLRANDDPWLYVLTAVACFSVLYITATVKHRVQSNRTGPQDLSETAP